ncbi:MAG: hypothetical protein IT162_22905, partial [Bryobacterales bacterium]|nr:hypothetical protein [Bryobacterales bacterium]
MDAILVCIDGTGPASDKEYEAAFDHSFVKTIHQQSTASHSWYMRGPAPSGALTVHKADAGLAYIKETLAQRHKAHTIAMPGDCGVKTVRGPEQPPPQIWLAGYSRGAAAVTYIASKLAPLPVDYLILFDSVNKLCLIPDADAAQVPSNVKRAIHALRDPSVGSREFFGTSGAMADKPGFSKQYYKTTHGGAGGTPWCLDPAVRDEFRPTRGPGGLKPSSKWKDKVVEMDAGERKKYYAAKLVTTFSRSEAQRQTDLNTFTNITFEDELKGCKEVWASTGKKLVQ